MYQMFKNNPPSAPYSCTSLMTSSAATRITLQLPISQGNCKPQDASQSRVADRSWEAGSFDGFEDEKCGKVLLPSIFFEQVSNYSIIEPSVENEL